MESYTMTPVGIIHSPYNSPAGMPIQSTGASGAKGTIEIFSPYHEALPDLEGFERIILIYLFHQSTGWSPMVTQYLDTIPHGLFATRAPKRPNPIGISVVRLMGIEDRILRIEDVDVLDNTPLLDIKPYIPAFDAFPISKSGWLEEAQHRVSTARSDDRFHR